MLNTRTLMLAAAMLFSLTAYSADQSAPAAQNASIADQLASNPGEVLTVKLQADNMGYLSAVVQNPTNETVANVFVVVTHLNEKTGQPDRQSKPVRVAKILKPGQFGGAQLPGVQVYRQTDLKLYQATVVRAELAK